MCSITSHLWTCQNAHTPGIELYQLAAEMEGVYLALSKVHMHRQEENMRERTFRRGRGLTGGCWFQKQNLSSSFCSAVPALENYCQSPGGLVGWECLQSQDLKGLLGLPCVATVSVLLGPSLCHQALHLNHKASPSHLMLPPWDKKCHGVSKTLLKKNNSVLAFSYPI